MDAQQRATIAQAAIDDLQAPSAGGPVLRSLLEHVSDASILCVASCINWQHNLCVFVKVFSLVTLGVCFHCCARTSQACTAVLKAGVRVRHSQMLLTSTKAASAKTLSPALGREG